MIIFLFTVYVFVINLTVPPSTLSGPLNNKFLVSALSLINLKS